MKTMLLLSVMLLSLVSRGQDFTPPCQWHRDGGEDLFEAMGMCGATSNSSVYAKYYCDASDDLYLGSYSDSTCTTLTSSTFEYEREHDCGSSLPFCSVDGGSDYDIARFEEHPNEDDCTIFMERFYFVFDSSVGITGNNMYYKVFIYNDSSLDRPFDGETIPYYSDSFVDRRAHCDVWSEDMGDTDGECSDEQRLISYSGTPNDEKTCFPQDCPDNKKPMEWDCAWAAHPSGGPCWWDALNMCMSSRHVYHDYDTGNVCKDGVLKCNDDQTIVSWYIYDSSDRSCSGNLLETIQYTNDTYAFNCSLPTCGTPGTTTSVVKFRRYDIFNCGGEECGSEGCDLETAAYGSYAWIYPGICNYYPEWCFNYNTECSDSNVGTYPDNTYQYFENVGYNASAVLDNTRSMCWSDSDAPTTSEGTATDAPTTSAQTGTDAPTTSAQAATDAPTTAEATTGTEDDATTIAFTMDGASGADRYNAFRVYGAMVMVTCLSLM
eukprot:892495_1